MTWAVARRRDRPLGSDLNAFWGFLDERSLAGDAIDVGALAEFAAWARRPAENVVVLAEEARAARRGRSIGC